MEKKKFPWGRTFLVGFGFFWHQHFMANLQSMGAADLAGG